MKNTINIYSPLCHKISFSTSFIFLAGIPPITQLSGTSFVTTAPATTTTLLPMVTLGRIVTFPPIHTSFPIVTGLPIPRCSLHPFDVIG